MPRVHRGKHLHQFRDDRPSQRAAGDDDGKLPPQRRVPAQIRNDELGNDEGQNHGNEGRDPDQRGERRFKVHVVRIGVPGFSDGFIDEVRNRAGHQHHDAHYKNPHQQFHLDLRTAHTQQDERDQGHTGHAVGFKAVSAGADRVAGVVTGAIGYHARIACIVFFDFEDDFHQVRADIGNLGEDTAGNTQSGRAQRFADGESDEAVSGIFRGDKEQNAKHDQQLNTDQHHADAHARLERNSVDGIRLAFEPGERRARVGEGVHANAEPRHTVAASDAHQAEEQNDDDPVHQQMFQDAEVQHDNDGDKRFKNQDELSLRDQIGFAGFIDQFRDLAHGAMHRCVLQLHVDDQAKQSAQSAKHKADLQQLMTADAEKVHALHVGQPEIGFPGGFRRGCCRSGLLVCGPGVRTADCGNLRSWRRGLSLLGKSHGKGEC